MQRQRSMGLPGRATREVLPVLCGQWESTGLRGAEPGRWRVGPGGVHGFRSEPVLSNRTGPVCVWGGVLPVLRGQRERQSAQACEGLKRVGPGQCSFFHSFFHFVFHFRIHRRVHHRDLRMHLKHYPIGVHDLENKGTSKPIAQIILFFKNKSFNITFFFQSATFFPSDRRMSPDPFGSLQPTPACCRLPTRALHVRAPVRHT